MNPIYHTNCLKKDQIFVCFTPGVLTDNRGEGHICTPVVREDTGWA